MKKLEKVINPPLRFLRSTHLERDFYDPKALESYVLTDTAIDCIRRISSGLRPNSGQKCWRIMGDYGSGKSSFALLLAHWFAGHASKFPKRIQSELSYTNFDVKRPKLMPILVTGARESLGQTICRGIEDSLNHNYPSGLGNGGKKITLLLKQDSISDNEVLKLIELVNTKITNDKKGNGLLFIIDELGKSLEHAASSAGENDVFLMQRLAESASRSGRKPVFIIGILHQGFGAYASALGLTAKREWDKVAGRYDEIVFQHPMEQTTALIAEALNVSEEGLSKTQIIASKRSMKMSVKAKWYGPAAGCAELERLAARILPLDAFVLPVMIKTLHRFGQNQRSIFSFLFGNEPFALQVFLSKHSGSVYRLHHFYDYIHSNLGHYLASSHISTNWTIIDSMVGAFVPDTKLHYSIIKTIGVLNLLNSDDLNPTAEIVSLCVTGRKADAEVLNAITDLQSDSKKKVLFDRGVAGGLCLWPHISVDLEKRQEVAESMIGSIINPADFIRSHLENSNLVARRHYIETGNLRHFPVVFCNPKDLAEPTALIPKDVDGVVLTPLCLSQNDVNFSIKMAKSNKNTPNCLILVPRKLKKLSPYIKEVQVWDWIATNTPALNGDKYGRETVSRKRAVAQQILDNAIADSIGLNNFGGSFALQSFWKGNTVKIESGRELLSKISDICDHLFVSAPKVHNELINRRHISSAAAGARMRLIERILELPDKVLLGMDPQKSPPEMSMYMSVIKRGGLHLETDNFCGFRLPNKPEDRLELLPAFTYMESELKNTSDKPVKVSDILNRLSQAPFGVRGGLAPLLLAIFYAIHKRKIACYEKGTFLSEFAGSEYLRLIKNPEVFEFQFCNIEGLRTVAFKRLAEVLKVSSNTDHPDLLDVVRPLCVIVASLRPYSQKTKHLSESAIAVRNALLESRDPLKLLFVLLPVACGCDPITPDNNNNKIAEKFAKRLSGSIDELKGCYAALQGRIQKGLMEHFGYSQNKTKVFRQEVGQRADALFSFVAEAKLKAFCFRMKDTVLSDKDWLDSVASMVASKPPEKWQDQDEQIFIERLSELASRFVRTEGVAFDKKGNYAHGSMRLCVTLPDGTEKKQVLATSKSDQKKVSDLQSEIECLIKENGDLALVAAAKAVWENLKG